MSFLNELPKLKLEEPEGPFLGCPRCRHRLEPEWSFCPECGDMVDAWGPLWLCSLHPKYELSQERARLVDPIEVVCLVCGATWRDPKKSKIGNPPDFFRTVIFKRYQTDYFKNTFGVEL